MFSVKMTGFQKQLWEIQLTIQHSAVMASLLPLLKEFEMSRIKHVNVISDSPTSQYRKKRDVLACEDFL